jgi:hypothetical protein
MDRDRSRFRSDDRFGVMDLIARRRRDELLRASLQADRERGDRRYDGRYDAAGDREGRSPCHRTLPRDISIRGNGNEASLSDRSSEG